MLVSVELCRAWPLAGLLVASLACGGGGGGGTGSGSSTTSGGTGSTSASDTTEGMADDTGSNPTGGDVEACARGAMVFDETVVHELSLQLSDADWAAMIQEAEDSPEYGGPDKTYFDAEFQFDGVPLASPLAVRLKGHSSLLVAREQGHSFPLKLDFDRVDPEQSFDGLTKLNLHTNLDGITTVNEYLSYGAIRAHGVPTARVGFARVTVNGEELGLYTMVEHLQGKFIRCHYDEPFGDLYKPEEPIGNLAWRGPTIGDYEPEIQFKWPDASGTDHASLLQLLTVINEQGVEAFAPVLDETQALTYHAMNVGVGNYDYYASFGHNYYLYESTPGRFIMLPWDMNFSQGVLPDPCGYGRNTTEWPISNKLLADPTRVQEYLGILEGFLMGAASPQSLSDRLDAVLPVLGDAVDAGAVQELRDAIDLRVQLQLQAIAGGIDTCPEFVEGGGRDECDTCIDTTCKSQLVACYRDADCECVADCVAEDEPVEQCLEPCGLTRTPPLFDALLECVFGPCGEQCQ
ncbi:MAG: CotH kinase family protein [Myxococcota bacterium]